MTSRNAGITYDNRRHDCRVKGNASGVTFTADVGIGKLKSDLFLKAIITAFLKGRRLFIYLFI